MRKGYLIWIAVITILFIIAAIGLLIIEYLLYSAARAGDLRSATFLATKNALDFCLGLTVLGVLVSLPTAITFFYVDNTSKRSLIGYILAVLSIFAFITLLFAINQYNIFISSSPTRSTIILPLLAGLGVLLTVSFILSIVFAVISSPAKAPNR